jgi:lysophospholipase L1-like esterase
METEPMKRRAISKWGVVLASLPLFLCAFSRNAEAQQGTIWVGTWATSPEPATGGFAMQPFSDVTLRQIAHISIGGRQLRIRFSNEFGQDPLTIGDAHVAISAGGSMIVPDTDRIVRFDGSTTVGIPPGAVVYSDPVALNVPPLSNVSVSIYLPSQVMRAETFHLYAAGHNFTAQGDQVGAASFSTQKELTSWYFFDGIDVDRALGGSAIVALGDSITDGARSRQDQNERWPDVLAGRLQADPGLAHLGVLNAGISGNRVLNDGTGPSALARLDRDVLAQDGAGYLIVLEGINDIGRLEHLFGPEDNITAQQLESGLKQIAQTARQHGMKAFGATLTPFEGSPHYSTQGEKIRETVNAWIRQSGTFDGVIDFDNMTRDHKAPSRLNPQFDSGDHLHPNSAGYKAMGAGIDLALFR